MRMSKHSGKDPGVENIAQARNKGEEEEEAEVEDKEDNRNYFQPVSIVRQLVKQNRYNSGAHSDDEPSFWPQPPDRL